MLKLTENVIDAVVLCGLSVVSGWTSVSTFN